MTPILLQTYIQSDDWQNGDDIKESDIVSKEEAHEKDLLHLSAHLLIINSQNRLLLRKRKKDDFRYADLWTSAIGTHVLVAENYYSTLQPFLPIPKAIEFVGEFRVHDEWENEVNGLYIMRANEEELPSEFLVDKQFFSTEELDRMIQENKTTPHLAGSIELLKSMTFKNH